MKAAVMSPAHEERDARPVRRMVGDSVVGQREKVASMRCARAEEVDAYETSTYQGIIVAQILMPDKLFEAVRCDDQASPNKRKDKGGGSDPRSNVSAIQDSKRGYVDRGGTFHNTRSAGMVTRRCIPRITLP